MTSVEKIPKDSSVQSHPNVYEKPNPKRILIIDDNVDAANSLSDLLKLSGHTVKTAYDAKSGLTEANSGEPEYIIIDICLPDKNGYELALEICSSTQQHLTLIALSGYSTPNDPPPPFDYFFSKPMTAGKLTAIGLLSNTSV